MTDETLLILMFIAVTVIRSPWTGRLYRTIGASFPVAAKKLNVEPIGPRPWRTALWIYWGLFRPSALQLPPEMLNRVRVEAVVSIVVWTIFILLVVEVST